MELSGTVVFLGETQEVGANKFKKRDVVIEIDGDSQYPQEVNFQVVKDKCDAAEDLQPGASVDFSFNIQGWKWNDPKTGKDVWFNTLQIWKFNVRQSAAVIDRPTYTGPVNTNPQGSGLPDPDDDLHF